MLKKVKIIQEQTDVIIAEYAINLRLPNASEKDFFDEAWVSAIENGLINFNSKLNYKFVMAEEMPQK